MWESPVAHGDVRAGGESLLWCGSSPTAQAAKDENEYHVWHSLHTQAMQVAVSL
jgi:hypothetical protein